jgi:hypothetical protein
MNSLPLKFNRLIVRNLIKKYSNLFSTSYLLWILFFVLFPQLGKAQEVAQLDSTRIPTIRHEVGFSGGLTIGTGMAYRLWIKNFGTQVSFAPVWQDWREAYNVGVSFYLLALKNPNFNFFLYQGNHFMSSNTYTEAFGYYFSNGIHKYNPARTVKDRNWNNGFGIGYEIFRGPGKFNPFGLSMMVGWAAYKNFTETNITGEITLLYKFNRNAHLQEKKSRR